MIIIKPSGYFKSLYVAPVTIRVKGRNGYTLAVYTIKVFDCNWLNNPIPLNLPSLNPAPDYSKTVSITSDDFEYIYDVLNYTPTVGVIFDVVAFVLDANGNPVERADILIIHSTNRASITVPKNAEVYIVTRFSQSVKIRYNANETVYIPKDIPCTVFIFWDGHLEIWDNGSKIHSIDGDSAIIPIKITISRTISPNLISLIDRLDITNILYKVPEVADVVGAVRWLNYLYESAHGRLGALGATVYYDSSNIYLEVTTYVDLHSPIDIWRVLTFIGGALLVVIGAITIAFTAGASIPVSVVLIASGIGMAVGGFMLGASIVYSGGSTPNVIPIYDEATKIIEQAKKKIDETKTNLYSYLDSLVSQGKITTSERDAIIGYVNDIISTSIKAMEDLRDKILEAYNKGYEAGYDAGKKETSSQYYAWIAVALAGGLLLGVLISR